MKTRSKPTPTAAPTAAPSTIHALSTARKWLQSALDDEPDNFDNIGLKAALREVKVALKEEKEKQGATILSDILTSMRGAAEGIQFDVQHKGFDGDVKDAYAVMTFCASNLFDVEDYAFLHANSATIGNGNCLIQRYGTAEQRAEATKLSAFYYNG